jgi:hypothetical protein
MSWYYASGGQQQGPVDDAQFEAMVQSGQIKPADLVWREGMANWQPLSSVRPVVVNLGPGAATPIDVPPVMGEAGVGADMVTCVECRGAFPKENAIQYGSTWVCATCKPIFLQKLREGAAMGGAVNDATRFPMGPTTPEEFVAGIRNRGYDVDLGSCLGRAWSLVTANLGLCIGATLILMLCMMGLGAASLIPCVGSLLQLALQGPLSVGFICIFLKLIREKNATIGDAFMGFSHGWLQLSLYNLVAGLIIVLFLAPAGVAMYAMEERWIGRSIPLLAGLFFLGAIPTIIFSISWFFASPLIVDRGFDFWSAMEVSRRVVWMHWWQILFLMVVVGIVATAGVFVLCVGLLITVPLALAAIAYAYEDIFYGPTATA